MSGGWRVRVGRVLHSGKPRAEQTAKILAALLAPGSAPEARAGLAPNDPIEGVAREKGALFRALSPRGVAIGNGDDARVAAEMESSPAARRVRYGTQGGLDLRIVERRPDGFSSSRVTLARPDGSSFWFRTPLIGEAGAYACAAAVAAAEAIGLQHLRERAVGLLAPAGGTRSTGSGGAGAASVRGADPNLLTGREVEILGLLAVGKSNAEIAEKLYLSVGTVHWYTVRIYQKLGVRGRVEAAAMAVRQGLVPGPRS